VAVRKVRYLDRTVVELTRGVTRPLRHHRVFAALSHVAADVAAFALMWWIAEPLAEFGPLGAEALIAVVGTARMAWRRRVAPYSRYRMAQYSPTPDQVSHQARTWATGLRSAWY